MHLRNALLTAVAVAAQAAAQQPARWRLVEEWRVGGAVQGAHAFDAVRDIKALPDGRLVVLEGKDQQVHILGARGAPARTIGRTGSGPGEFRNAIGIVVTRDGGFIVNDADNARYTTLREPAILSARCHSVGSGQRRLRGSPRSMRKADSWSSDTSCGYCPIRSFSRGRHGGCSTRICRAWIPMSRLHARTHP